MPQLKLVLPKQRSVPLSKPVTIPELVFQIAKPNEKKLYRLGASSSLIVIHDSVLLIGHMTAGWDPIVPRLTALEKL